MTRKPILWICGKCGSGSSSLIAAMEDLAEGHAARVGSHFMMTSTFGLQPFINKKLVVIEMDKKGNATNFAARLMSIQGGDRQTIHRKYDTDLCVTIDAQIVIAANWIPGPASPLMSMASDRMRIILLRSGEG